MTKELKCDVLVVGGGPAGSSSAIASAKRGLKTILIEEDPEIGLPVQCAESISTYLLKFLPFNVEKKLFKHKIDGLLFSVEDFQCIRQGKLWEGYSISREEFDKWLASRAKSAGVKILTETRLVDVEIRDGKIREVYALSRNEHITFKPKYVIAADGVNTTVGKKTNLLDESFTRGAVKEFEFKNVDLLYPNIDQIFFGEFAPCGYAYIFPLSKSRANVGVASIYDKMPLDKKFEEFLEIGLVKKQLRDAEIVSDKSGYAPIDSPSVRWQYGNIFFVGDAANHNIKPFVEGIIPSVVCGYHLGDSLPLSDVEYRKLVNGKLGGLLEESEHIKREIISVQNLSKDIRDMVMLAIFSGSITHLEEIENKDIKDLQELCLSKK